MKSKNLNEREVAKWRENFLRLDDSSFFTIMRLYLGQLKTPYNKQNLVTQLEGFLRREETQQNILTMLSDEDKMILCAIKFIPNAQAERLIDFFAGDFSSDEFDGKLHDLCTRLLIYAESTASLDGAIYKITPLLKKPLAEIFQSKILFPEFSSRKKLHIKTENPLGAELIGAFLSYISQNKKLNKMDGTFKKRTEEEIEEKFPGHLKALSLLARACVVLQLVRENEGHFEVDWKAFELFAKLKNEEQLLYLLGAASEPLSKDGARAYAQYFLSALNAIPNGGFSENVFLRYASLLAIQNSSDRAGMYFRTSRFASIVQAHSSPFGIAKSPASTIHAFFERMLQNAIDFGIVKYAEIDNIDGDEEIAEKIPAKKTPSMKHLQLPQKKHERAIFKNENLSQSANANSQMIHIDSAFNITLMQGFPLEKILNVAKFSDLIKFDTAAQFEITRESAIRAFDSGMTSADIILTIKQNTPFPISNPLEFSLKEWEASYNSATVYNGFVIKLDEKLSSIAERNNVFSQRIFARLAPGIFVLDCTDEEQVKTLLISCGLASGGKINSVKNFSGAQGFSPLKTIELDLDDYDFVPTKHTEKNEDVSEQAIQALYKKIDETNLSPEEKNTLRELAASKIIVNPSQIASPSIPTEKHSAQGMDYTGKVHIIEEAIRKKEQILFRLSKGARLKMARPLSIDRNNFSDGHHLLVLEKDEKKDYSIGKIEFVQRLHKTW